MAHHPGGSEAPPIISPVVAGWSLAEQCQRTVCWCANVSSGKEGGKKLIHACSGAAAVGTKCVAALETQQCQAAACRRLMIA